MTFIGDFKKTDFVYMDIGWKTWAEVLKTKKIFN